MVNSIPDKEVEADFNKLVAKIDEESKKVETPKAQIEHKQHIVSDVEGGNALFLNELRKNGLI